MAEFDADVAVSEPFSCEDPMEECLDDVFVDGDFGEIGGTTSKEDGIVKTESESHFGESSLGSEQILEDVCGTVGSTVEAGVSMDAVDRLDESFFSSGVLGSEGEKPLHEKAPRSEVKERVEVSGRIPEMKISMLLETTNVILEGSNPADETVNSVAHLNTESLAKGDGVIEEPMLTNGETDGKNIESVSDVPAGDEVAAVEETINVDEDKVSVSDNDITDTADLNPIQDGSAHLEEATLEVEEVLTDEVAVADDSCDKSLRESKSLVVGINECSFDDETQVMEIGEEFPMFEVDGVSTVENGKEYLTSGTESEVNGDDCLHKDEKLNTATTKNAELALIDTQEILQVPTDNSSHESVSVLDKTVELKVGTLGETSVEDHCASIDSSPIEDQTTSLGTKSQNLEAHIVTSDQPAAIPVSDAMNFVEIVVTDETIESYENAGQISQRMVLNKGKESVKEDVHLEEVVSHMKTGAEFSEYFVGNTNVNGDIFSEAEIVERDNVEEHEIDMREQISEPDQGNDVELKKVSNETTPRPRAKVDLATHMLPEESEAGFSVSDLVWGKVKSHPWWPGQVYDPEDASEKAMKHHKNDCFLVAYFGDRTFAWNEGSVLKPFWQNFSGIEKQSSSEVFQNAINSALDEVSRRIMLGLACFCIPNDIYSKIECQIVENTGIRKESSRRYGLDESTKASFLKPNKLVEYVRALAESPSAGTDQLGLVIAKAQLLAFNQMRGYYSLPEFEYCGGLLESDYVDGSVLDQADECTPNDNTNKELESENRNSLKRKHNLKDGSYSRKRKRRLSELMGDEGSVEQDKRISFYAAKISSTVSPIPKPSFKVGDCIRRAASQLTGSLSISRNGNENLQKVNRSINMQTPDNSHTSPVENSSLDEMLLQLQMLARDPVKGHSYGYGITNFFSGFRDSIHSCKYAGRMSSATEKPDVARKRKVSHVSPEEFEFDDVGDSYWTDMTIENHSEGQPGGFLNSKHYQLVTLDAEKSLKSSRRGYPKKRFSNANHHEMDLDEPMKHINQVRQANLPVELILNFPEADSIPSEMHLNKTFRRFGPLKKTDTEIDLETNHARVVFKRCSDAEVAFNSSRKFSIFGPMFVNYELNYSPSTSFNTFTFATSGGLENVA